MIKSKNFLDLNEYIKLNTIISRNFKNFSSFNSTERVFTG